MSTVQSGPDAAVSGPFPAPWIPPDPATLAAVMAEVRFDSAGLVAAIAQDHQTGRVLMMAWMNQEALTLTLTTGRVVYWSRSRRSLWRKGDTSGHHQSLLGLQLDCDGDALLLQVEQAGAACHTNRRSCFYREVRPDRLLEIEAPLPD